MNVIEIKRHNFEEAKNRLKEFSEKKEVELELKAVKEEGDWFWGWIGEHNVTGAELNKILKVIHDHFISVNATNNKIIKEFREVYNALEALDKEYITSILSNVKDLEEATVGINKNHNKIEKNLDLLLEIVGSLKDLKEEYESYEHMQDIDNMWNDIDICKNNIEKINENIQTQQSELDIIAATSENHTESIASLSEKLADTEEYATDSRNLITKLETFKEKVSALNHLMEVDEIWKQGEEHQIRIKQVEQEGKAHTDKLNELEQTDSKMYASITSNADEISFLKKYKDKLSGISHLDDIDGMWNDIEEHASKLIESRKRDAELVETIQKSKEEVNENIAIAVQATNGAIETLTKKVKYAYWIAGGAVGLAIIELILILTKVI